MEKVFLSFGVRTEQGIAQHADKVVVDLVDWLWQRICMLLFIHWHRWTLNSRDAEKLLMMMMIKASWVRLWFRYFVSGWYSQFVIKKIPKISLLACVLIRRSWCHGHPVLASETLRPIVLLLIYQIFSKTGGCDISSDIKSSSRNPSFVALLFFECFGKYKSGQVHLFNVTNHSYKFH